MCSAEEAEEKCIRFGTTPGWVNVLINYAFKMTVGNSFPSLKVRDAIEVA